MKENYFNANITKVNRNAIFFIVFSENLASPKMNQTFSDIEIDVNIQRSFQPMVDFNWTILNNTERWVKVKLDFLNPFEVSEDDLVIVNFPDPKYFVSLGKLLVPGLILNQKM